MTDPERQGIVATVDDDPDIRSLLRLWLTQAGYTVEEHATGASILARNPRELSVVCLDLNLADMGGREVLARLKAADPDLPVIMVTVERAIEAAVNAMQHGAYDFIPKPPSLERTLASVARAHERRQLTSRVHRLEGASRVESALVGDSTAMREVRNQLEQIENAQVPVCILGESGSGKELVARAIHEHSQHRDGPFIAINCAAIPETLQESELFGHERGAFTGAVDTYRGRFEQANGGTLFLDEVGEMHLATQAKLLRVLQERTFRRVGGRQDLPMNARIVCATNRDLEAEVEAGRFRSDLFFRLVVYPIRVPPLRQRRDDIPRLVGHLLRRLREVVGREVTRIEPDALDVLVAHHWPGNVRELENVLQRAMLSSRGNEITLADLPRELRGREVTVTTKSIPATKLASRPPPRLTSMREIEQRAIQQALEQTRGDVSSAARILGMSRATLYRRLAGAGAGTGAPGPSLKVRT